MTIHFAPAKRNGHSAHCVYLTRALTRVSIGKAANDNSRTKMSSRPSGHAGASDGASGKVLEAALRHFGQHGLGAARAARIRAKQAFFEGDRAAYDWWLSITYVLDRRIAGTTPAFPNPVGHAAADIVGQAANSPDEHEGFPPENAG